MHGNQPKTLCGVASLLALSLAGSTLSGQTPGQPASPPPYRAPLIALVQPAGDDALPHDKPIVMFRFSPGETADPVDVRSFAVVVDDKDRTPGFQVTATEAWGPVRDVEASGEVGDVTPSTHNLAVRICSVRGACAHITASVRVQASPAVVRPEPTSRRDGLIDVLIRALRRLLPP